MCPCVQDLCCAVASSLSLTKAGVAGFHRQEFDEHVGVLPQCACNSYMWKGSLRQWLRLIRDPWVVKSGAWDQSMPASCLLQSGSFCHIGCSSEGWSGSALLLAKHGAAADDDVRCMLPLLSSEWMPDHGQPLDHGTWKFVPILWRCPIVQPACTMLRCHLLVAAGLHRHGDFLLHLAGIREKLPHINDALQHINDVEPQQMSSVKYLELAAVETA